MNNSKNVVVSRKWNDLTKKTLIIFLQNFVESEDKIHKLSMSNNVPMADIQSSFQTGQSNFVITMINIQSINARFDNLYSIMNNLSASGQYFGAIFLQETWLTSDTDMPPFAAQLWIDISRCANYGGLIIYLHEKYCSEVRNLYSSSDIWEGLVIHVNGHDLRERLTIGNIYRPPHDNSKTQKHRNLYQWNVANYR